MDTFQTGSSDSFIYPKVFKWKIGVYSLPHLAATAQFTFQNIRSSIWTIKLCVDRSRTSCRPGSSVKSMILNRMVGIIFSQPTRDDKTVIK